MARKACHVFTSTTRFGLTQALGARMDHQSQADLLSALIAAFPGFEAEWKLDCAPSVFPDTSLHSVYMSFLPFLSRTDASPKQFESLAAILSGAVAAGGNAEKAVSNSFFEALGPSDPLFRKLRPLLSPEAKVRLRAPNNSFKPKPLRGSA